MSYPYQLALLAELNRKRVYDKVIEALEKAAAEQGITQSKLAQLIGRKPSQVSAWLSGPSNWTLDTISDLLRAVSADMDYSVVFDTDRRPANIVHPASLGPDPSVVSGTRQVETTSSNASVTGAVPVTGTKGEALWQTIPQQGNCPLPQPSVSGISNIVSYIQTQT